MKEILLGTKFKKPLSLALGFFDSIHKGHAKLIKRCIELASANDCMPAIMTFNNNPYDYITNDVKLIFSYDERVDILKSLGIDVILYSKFDQDFKQITAEQFLKILSNFNLRHIVCGTDFRFGFGGQGDVYSLTQYCSENNIALEVVDDVLINDKKISSTLIRQFILNGDVKKANQLLSTKYFMQGKVIQGNQIGHKLLYPTINTKIDKDKLKLKEGVYLTQVNMDGQTYKSVSNCGSKPTFNDGSYTIETFILDFDKNVYGHTAKIIFIDKIRDIIKFNDIAQLKNQITSDINFALNYKS